MDEAARPLNRNLRISPFDRRGRTISTAVLGAAEQIGRRAIEYAGQMLIDPAIAATLLEDAAATVSRTINSKRYSSQSGVLTFRPISSARSSGASIEPRSGN
jgi:hypothetical protein